MSDETGFNDAELQDIMNEIESLEKEFVEEEQTSQPEAVEAAAEPEVVEAEAEPVAEEPAEEEPVVEEPVAESEPEPTPEPEVVEEVVAEEPTPEPEPVQEEPAPVQDNVVAMDSPAPEFSGGSQMDFQGSGQMDFQMTFMIGESQAKVWVSKEKGLVVTMDGVDMNISEDGCSVEMEGGVKFSIPFGPSKAGQKAA